MFDSGPFNTIIKSHQLNGMYWTRGRSQAEVRMRARATYIKCAIRLPRRFMYYLAIHVSMWPLLHLYNTFSYMRFVTCTGCMKSPIRKISKQTMCSITRPYIVCTVFIKLSSLYAVSVQRYNQNTRNLCTRVYTLEHVPVCTNCISLLQCNLFYYCILELKSRATSNLSTTIGNVNIY